MPIRDCFICRRPEPYVTIDNHHLIKRSQGGYFGETADLCRTCHDCVDNGDWCVYVNGEPIGLKVKLEGHIQVYREDLHEVVCDWYTNKDTLTPDNYGEVKPMEVQYSINTLEGQAAWWDQLHQLGTYRFAAECELSTIIRDRTPKDPRWIKANGGKGDWAEMASKTLSNYAVRPIRAGTLRERALVWDRLAPHGSPWKLITNDYAHLRSIDFTRAVHIDKDKPTRVLDELAELLETTGRLPSIREIERHYGYSKPEVRPTWGPEDEDWIQRLVGSPNRKDPPTQEEASYLSQRRKQ